MNKEANEFGFRHVAAMWAQIVYLQATRLEEAIDEYQEIVAGNLLGSAFEEAGKPTDWAEFVQSNRRLKMADIAKLAADKHFFLVAIAQVVKCASRLQGDALPDFKNDDLLRLLRNVDEHWEDPNGPSAAALRRDYPDITPGHVYYNTKDIWLGTVSLMSILEWVSKFDYAVRLAAAESGSPIEDEPELPTGSRFQRILAFCILSQDRASEMGAVTD